jgi:hypothetical protein
MLSATDIVQEMKDQTSLGNEFLTQAIGLAAAEAALVGSTRK